MDPQNIQNGLPPMPPEGLPGGPDASTETGLPQPPQEGVSQFAPPAGSPPEAADPFAQETEIIGPEHLQEMSDLIEKTKGALGHYTAGSIAGKNKARGDKSLLIRKVLLALRDSGVNISDQEQVTAFIEELREFNPDLAELFDKFMSQLLSDEEGPAEDLSEGAEEPLEEAPETGGLGAMMGQPPIPGAGSLGLPTNQPSLPGAGLPKKYETLSQNIRERVQGGGQAGAA